MVGRDVQEHADLRVEAIDVLELEAGELAHDPRVGIDVLEARERAAHVAGHLDGTPGGAEDLAEQLGRRRLAVRAGDAQDRIAEQPRAELDLAPHGNAMLARSGDDRRLRRNPGAFHEHVHGLDQRGVVRAESHFYALGAKPPRVQLLVAVDRGDRHAAPDQREGGRLPGAGEPHDERGCGKVEIGHDHGQMRVAALFDVHGNLPALEAVLAEPDVAGAEIVVCGGDTVSGPMPRECIALLRGLGDRLRYVHGNGERAVVDAAGAAPSDDELLEQARWCADAARRGDARVPRRPAVHPADRRRHARLSRDAAQRHGDRHARDLARAAAAALRGRGCHARRRRAHALPAGALRGRPALRERRERRDAVRARAGRTLGADRARGRAPPHRVRPRGGRRADPRHGVSGRRRVRRRVRPQPALTGRDGPVLRRARDSA